MTRYTYHDDIIEESPSDNMMTHCCTLSIIHRFNLYLVVRMLNVHEITVVTAAAAAVARDLL